MNKERLIDDRATLILLLTSSPPCHLKGEVLEASLKSCLKGTDTSRSLLVRTLLLITGSAGYRLPCLLIGGQERAGEIQKYTLLGDLWELHEIIIANTIRMIKAKEE